MRIHAIQHKQQSVVVVCVVVAVRAINIKSSETSHLQEKHLSTL